MTLDTEERIETSAPVATVATSPPRGDGEPGYRLFQTMDELRTRHGTVKGAKHHMIHAAAALIGGSLLFAALYAAILFLEY